MSGDKNDKGKSILGAPPKVVKKETKQNNHHSTNKKSQPKKPHFYHYCRAFEHTCPNCYKWLATQQSNNVSPLGAKINSNSLWPLLKNFLRLSYYSQTLMDSTLLLIHLNNDLCKKKKRFSIQVSHLEGKRFQVVLSLSWSHAWWLVMVWVSLVFDVFVYLF